MYNVPHKYRQVCRLCLTLVNECDIGDLQIYNSETGANETVSSQHKLYANQCNINENASKCVCNASDPNTCCYQSDNSLSTEQSNKEVAPCNPQSQHKNNYTPSVPSAIANPPCTTENNIYARMFSNKARLQAQPTASQLQLQSQKESREATNPIGHEEQQFQHKKQHDIVHDNAKSSSTSTKHVFHDIGEYTSSNENYNQEHKDDSSPHITIQIFNCLSIKVRQSCF